MEESIIITTTNDLPGYEVVEVYGEVFGLIDGTAVKVVKK